MQPKKTKIALLVGAAYLGASGAINAATANFDVTVTTIPDVTLSEVAALDFGTSMFVTAGGACLMDATTPGNTVARMQYISATIATAANFGDLTGTGCVNGTATGTPGIYKISGVAGQAVNITISGVTGTDFNFSPNSGCIVNYDGTTAADTCTSFVPGAVTARNLAAATEDDPATTAGGEASVAGELVFTVGGTVTVGGTDLAPNQAYTENFPVVVVY